MFKKQTKNQSEPNSRVFQDLKTLREIKKSHRLEHQTIPINTNSLTEPGLFDDSLSQFQRLASILYKKMMEQTIPFEEFEDSTQMDREILLLFLKKKKMCPEQLNFINFTELNDRSHFAPTKRIEENMKFTLNRFFRFIWDYFRANLYPNVRKCLRPHFRLLSEQVQFNYCFYGFYFEDAALKIRVRLEKFFHPQKSQGVLKGQGFLLPKSVSYLYFSFLKMSQLFVSDFKFFMKRKLMTQVCTGIGMKIGRMCLDWEKIFFKKNSSYFLKRVRGFLKHNSKYKLAWSLREVQFAVRQIEGVLNN